MSRSTTFTLRLRTHSAGAYRRLRRTLKTALRRDQLRAIDIRETRVSRCRTRASPKPKNLHGGDMDDDVIPY
jgi:hypothetical protein